MMFPFCFCLFLSVLHFIDGCYVSGHRERKEVTGYTGGSVLLPCSCTHPQSTVKTFTWKHYYNRPGQWTEVFQDKKYKNRLKLFNQSSPANLSLLISDLRKNDEGLYRCEAQQTTHTFTDINLKIQGCDLDQNKPAAEITGHSGESVVLPCSCTELQDKPEQLTWTFTAPNKNSEEIYPHEQSERDTGRVRLLNEISPGNLSLQISNLTKEDQGEYRCSVSSQQHINITLRVQDEPIKQEEGPTTKLDFEKQLFILLSVLPVVLLLAVLALIYWKYRGRRDAQKMTNDGLVLCSENEKQDDVNPESVTQGENLKQDEDSDEVTYSSVVHIKADTKPAHKQFVMAENSEYASIK
ncbi:hepatocyte cell adhesion molecule-like isoform X1 [Carassius gibelio]|uniref:hepatocyte cell adhesion molecule-like isoform X1 n=1 Tax=Carassius gibelio TaxID=101364 RepID=UPI002278281F|nr:hepatocyte cell adhesion molecule-like isoform X1 [Carassius gibelio]